MGLEIAPANQPLAGPVADEVQIDAAEAGAQCRALTSWTAPMFWAVLFAPTSEDLGGT
jgi:hypothetical protein